ncbi:MAG: hypothetical protein LBI30_02890 [Holosporales bacterium]|jgi:hypothetical protein|nr:hypothetical protein [Holosporales bacterium]
MRKFGVDSKKELGCNFADVMSSIDFADLVNELNKIRAVGLDDKSGTALYLELSKLSSDDIKTIAEKTRPFIKYEKLFSCSENNDWAVLEFNKIKNAKFTLHVIAKKIDEILSSIRDVAEIIDDYEIEYNCSIKQIYIDAKDLKGFVEKGKSVSKFNLFMPKRIKDCLHLFESVKINGKACSGSDLDILIKVSYFHMRTEEAWRLLNQSCQIAKLEKLSYFLQAAQIATINETIKELVDAKKIFEEYGRFAKSIQASFMLDHPVAEVESTCNYIIVERQTKEILQKNSELEEQLTTFIQKENVHFIMVELLNAVKSHDINKYECSKLKLDSLLKERDEFCQLKQRIIEVEKIIPITIREMESSCDDLAWKGRIEQIENAWYWSQANSWIINYINKDNIPAIKASLKQIDVEINNVTAKLSALKTWEFCLNRLTADQKRHMSLWCQAVRKLGKGTGKYVNRRRKEAREHLNKCVEAIPAWIMPLHDVWDNVESNPGVFDVVIVDEASQCGLEALPLFYYAKKMLIVGDDKQISPENVGLELDTIYRWQDEYLQDLGEYKDLLSIDRSLFDIGRVIYSSKVVLREHFRCMPEIIKFSNDLCYSDTPLIPMKQYGMERLSPLENVFLSDGYKEGDVNKVEAEAIVNKVAEICKDNKYADKSIGIIALQGSRQVDLIEANLIERLEAREIEKHKILCGTPASFQGDERDIFFCSRNRIVASTF